ncbi:MAG: hypothetical protein MUF24_13355, partial [Chitinophagaceae bacterium]|nr:hypothetical protein [Chitinophagaceae bacterium]
MSATAFADLLLMKLLAIALEAAAEVSVFELKSKAVEPIDWMCACVPRIPAMEEAVIARFKSRSATWTGLDIS